MTNPYTLRNPGRRPNEAVGRAAGVTLDALRTAVTRALDPDAAMWFAKAREQVDGDRAALGRLFPAVSRKCGRSHLWPVGLDLIGWTVDDAVRALLLLGAGIEDVTVVYAYGDPAERRAVLRALHLLDLGDSAVPLVLDALRTNDSKLIAAAVGPYAAKHLPAQPWRQAVLTCVVQAVPLAWVADLKRRADDELVRMLRSHVLACDAENRPIPPDLKRLLRDLCPEADAYTQG